MSWAIFAKADGIMRVDKNGWQVHESGKPDGRTHVIGKDEEGGAIGSKLGERHAVENRAHCVLADAELEVAPGVIVGFESAFARDQGYRGRRKISRANH